ncbi:MAG: hypothetical protein WC820_04305 [Spirochaetales bacterium]
MSRAFIDEDAGSDEADGMHEIPLPLSAGARNYVTSESSRRPRASNESSSVSRCLYGRKAVRRGRAPSLAMSRNHAKPSTVSWASTKAIPIEAV